MLSNDHIQTDFSNIFNLYFKVSPGQVQKKLSFDNSSRLYESIVW